MTIKNCLIIALIGTCLMACGHKGDKGKDQTIADTAKPIKDTTGQYAKTDTTVKKNMLTDTAHTDSASSNWLVIPGKGIGHIMLNDGLDKVSRQLGRPDSSDAAMGSSLLVWFAKHDPAGYRTSIFAHRNMGGKDEAISHVQKILVTSPMFKTADGAGVGSTMAGIKKAYTLKPTSNYNNHGSKVQVYTDLAKGISFEMDGDKCVGIVVHKVNDTASAYLNMH